ncbi:peptidoglycan D,D-transpeptidase FtsI family protein [Alkalihalobacillus sp. CinArs1]|uniref:peptidoglycan D,D-transpeptidase FtsI family protein n=1 Tax=Alkalihalobacillus sp. CinArs1 TaxID=2995314 RepID=UPI0022DDA3EE|nr:penicillin-binding protein 2 [Alkalihalobacillus sp. CinArs1]
MNPNRKKKNHVPIRLNILFLSVFILFSVLVLRLGVIQIVDGEEYERVSEQTENVTAESSAPRGKMYDRYGRVLVDNNPEFALTYIRTQNTNQSERLDLARKLAELIEKDSEEVTDRDLKDYWIVTRPEEAKQKLSEQEWENLDSTEAYKLQIERIDDKDLAEIKADETELEVAAIKRAMDNGYALSSQTIKMGLTEDEIARISENLGELPGVDIQADATREYPYGETLQTIFGNVGHIPRESLTYYRIRDYDRNDQVGISYLEKQYEEYLKGQKEKQKFVTDKSGEPIGEPEVIEGQRGNDLVLSIDIDLQQQVEEILEEELRDARKYGATRGYVVMMDPATGEVLSIAGKAYNNGKYTGRTFGVIGDSYAMGSTIKGATVLTGYQYDVINPNDMLVDEVLRFSNGQTKSSYTSRAMGRISDLVAIQKSSNVYMFKIAMMMAGYDYEPNKRSSYNPEAYNQMREAFSQFGLGVPTGIDLPGESAGLNGGIGVFGNLLDLSIGQYDTYTPMQMAQYVSTIANGGYRIKPHLLKEVHEPSESDTLSNTVLFQHTPEVLNKVKMSKDEVEHIQRGMWMVMNTKEGTAGTNYNFFQSDDYVAAGKTGTAQIGEEYNLTLVGFAPYNDPEVAFSVVIPEVNDSSSGFVNKKIGGRILDAYFDLKNKAKVPSGSEIENKDKE